MMRFMELLPQIRDFWELQDQEAQLVRVLAVHTAMFSDSCDKRGKYIELEIQGKKKARSMTILSEVQLLILKLDR